MVIDKKQTNLWLRIKVRYRSFGQKDQDRLKISIHKSFLRLNSCTLIEAIIVFVSNLLEIRDIYIILNVLILNM